MLATPPTVTIKFYPFGILLHRVMSDGTETEYPIDPAQLAEALAAKVEINTGLLSGNTIYVATKGVTRLVVDYRPPQKTGLFLEGSENAVRIPLPGLLLFRTVRGGDFPNYRVFAVKSRPDKLDMPLFHAPLPNTSNTGICWGSVKKPSAASLKGNDLTEDWRLLLGSKFGNHSCNGKSKSHGKDIREKYTAMEQRKTRTYPTTDLVAAKRSLQSIIEEMLG